MVTQGHKTLGDCVPYIDECLAILTVVHTTCKVAQSIDHMMMQLLSSILALWALLVATSALHSGGRDELISKYSSASSITTSRRDVSITWDKYSWIVNGERVMVRSGEVRSNFLCMRII